MALASLAPVALLAACGSASDSRSPEQSHPPASIPAASTGTPSATPPNDEPPLVVWSEDAFDGQVTALSVDGAQFVAVGATAAGPTSWTSADARAWESHAVPQPDFLDQYLRDQGQQGNPSLYVNVARMGPLARLADTLFSFGTFGGDNDFFRPLGWRSPDGGDWQFIQSQSGFFDECCSIVDLVAGDPGLLAIKQNFSEYSGELWLWTADTSWVRTWGIELGEADDLHSAEIDDALWAEGRFVAVGRAARYDAGTSQYRTAASSWISTDGRSWQAASPSDDRDGSVMQSVSPMPGGGFVAVGCAQCTIDGLGTPAAWTSPDGLEWTPVGLPASFTGTAYGVLPIDDGLLAVGVAPDGTATWTSADGVHWEAGQLLETLSNGPRVSFRAQTHNIAARDGEVILALSRGTDELGELLGSVLWRGVVQE